MNFLNFGGFFEVATPLWWPLACSGHLLVEYVKLRSVCFVRLALWLILLFSHVIDYALSDTLCSSCIVLYFIFYITLSTHSHKMCKH